ncbi:MAG: HAD-IIIA family hydrolase, partial [Chloroflexi bacterium]|nr:HAD-IIIA family hydrolase [Chloroflexota bacterium]
TARGLRVVVTGSAAERPIVDALVARTVSPLVDVVGRTSLGAELAGFYYCPHHPEGSVTEFAVECSCRKPAEGMILRAAAELGINPAESWMVGDTLDDVEAGNRAGCRTILLDNGNETEWRVDGKRWPSVVVGDLDRAAAIIAGVEEPSKVQYTP